MNRDGTVRSAQLLKPAATQNARFQAAAESAMAALHDPHCQPLSFPPDKYDKWKNFSITFDGSYFEEQSR
jgi:hypothetical protein